MARLINLLRRHPSVASWWLMIACIAIALGLLLAINGFVLMALLAFAIAAYAVLFLVAVERYGKGNLRNVTLVIRSSRARR